MKISTASGQTFDTERDLTAAERHVLQKLFLWETMANSLGQFREKKREALQKGWNNSGPVAESLAHKTIIKDMEKKVADRPIRT